MTNKRPIFIKGVEYSSLEEACDYYELDYEIVCEKLDAGWDIDDIFNEDVTCGTNAKNVPITVEGVEYPSIKKACEHYKLKYTKVYSRLTSLDWSIEEAFELVERSVPRYSKSITVEGVEYPSIKNACDYYKLAYQLVISRLNYGWSIDEAFELTDKPKREKNHNSKSITVEGVEYPSIKKACEHYKLKYDRIKLRLRMNWTIDEAFDLVKRKREYHSNKGEFITVEGVTYPSIKKACDHYKLNYPSVVSRLSNGWSIEKAFELIDISDGNHGKPITVGDVTYPSIKKACDHYKLNYGVVIYRLNNDWSVDEAFELVRRQHRHGKSITVNNIRYPSIKIACLTLKMDYNLVNYRLNNNWSIDEAFGFVKRFGSGNKIPITVEGIDYPSLKEACDHYNVNYNNVRYRLNAGWSVERVFGIGKYKKS